jgi:hypothetical protein
MGDDVNRNIIKQMEDSSSACVSTVCKAIKSGRDITPIRGVVAENIKTAYSLSNLKKNNIRK